MRQLKITRSITRREDSIDKYLLEIGKEELISPEEEIELAQRIKRGDQKAIDKLVKANLRFVVSVSKQYQNQGLTLPDLINEGNIGLIKAVQRFDETKGFKFISYAVWWIRQSILQALAEQARIVRLPLNKVGEANKINRSISDLEQQLERPPTEDDVSDLAGHTIENVKLLMNSRTRHVSMDAPLATDGETNLYDVFLDENSSKPDAGLISESLEKNLDRSLKSISEREAEIIRKFYGLNGRNEQTLDEIAKDLDLTRERVRQIKERAEHKLKQSSRAKLLRKYLG
jgi:RNA polymerase primary sigma factor